MFLARCLLAWLSLLLPVTASAQQRISLTTRPGVTQPFLLQPADHPVATVLLFPGGSGVLDEVRSNFLLRVAPDFAAQHLTVAILDAPSDAAAGMSPAFRASGAHARDIGAVAAWLRARMPLPLWLVGTSRGTISAANAGVALGPAQVAGVVLTSSVWQSGMAAVPLGQLRVPTLIVHNRDDGCRESPFAGAEPALRSLTQAPAKALITVSGGALRSLPCQARSPHGYLGIEGEVVPAIIAWIKTHAP